jgi:hypothetical protein
MSGSSAGVFMIDKKSLRNLVRHLVLENVSAQAPGGGKPYDPDFLNRLLDKLIFSEDLFVDYSADKNQVTIEIVRDKQGQEEREVLAFIDLVNNRNKPCLEAWEVASVFSYGPREGWGRLLYDIAMEKLGLIMSDRESVSSKARPIWDSFAQRSGEIERVQLDDIYDTLTPGFERDNCAIAPWDVVSVPGKDYDLNPEFEADIKRLRGDYLKDPVGKERERPKSIRTGPRKSGPYKLTAPKHASLKDVDETSDDNKETREYYRRLLNGPLAGAYRKKGKATPVLNKLIDKGKFREK